MKRASLLEAIMPTHAKLMKTGRADLPVRLDQGCAATQPHLDEATMTREQKIAFIAIALAGMLRDRNWKDAQTTAERLDHELRLKLREDEANAAGVVKRPRHD